MYLGNDRLIFCDQLQVEVGDFPADRVLGISAHLRRFDRILRRDSRARANGNGAELLAFSAEPLGLKPRFFSNVLCGAPEGAPFQIFWPTGCYPFHSSIIFTKSLNR
jgi:hypothetical protein